jgi:hypothetical protein
LGAKSERVKMKPNRHIWGQLWLALLCACLGRAQSPDMAEDCHKQYANPALTEIQVGTCWQKLELAEFTLYAPVELKSWSGRKYDNETDSYTSSELYLQIGYGSAAPTNYAKYESKYGIGVINYSDKVVTVDGEAVWLWFYETPNTADKFRYNALARYRCYEKERENTFTLALYSKTIDIKVLAEKVFTSLRFTNRKEPVPVQPDAKGADAVAKPALNLPPKGRARSRPKPKKPTKRRKKTAPARKSSDNKQCSVRQ